MYALADAAPVLRVTPRIKLFIFLENSDLSENRSLEFEPFQVSLECGVRQGISACCSKKKSASKRCLWNPNTLQCKSLFASQADEGVENFSEWWLTVWSYAVSYSPWLLSCSTPGAVRPDRGQFTVPSHHGRQNGSQRTRWKSVLAPSLHQCSSGSSLLRKPRA